MMKTCDKKATFNKEEKKSGKFCEEQKKEGIISVIYKYHNNKVTQMDQVFKALPLDLQWEILVDFVGGYVVHNNRLMRLLSGDLHKKIMEHNFEINIDKYVEYRQWTDGLWAKPVIKYPLTDSMFIVVSLLLSNVKCFKSTGQPLHDDFDPERLLPVASAMLGLGLDVVVLFQTTHTCQFSYGFFNWTAKCWYITEVDDSIILPPFEKHIYPSYPNTNKKLGRPVMKMKLHNPMISILWENS